MSLNEQQTYAQEQNNCSCVVEAHAESSVSAAFCCFESLELGSCQVSGNTGVAAWAIASADLLAGLEAHASDVVSLDGSRVVTAWRRSSENGELLAVGVNLQSVLGVDQINTSPTKREGAQGIDNGQAIVIDNELWANVDQPSAGASECCDAASNQGGLEVALECNLNEKADKDRANNASENESGFWAEGFLVAHPTIFSQTTNELTQPSTERK